MVLVPHQWTVDSYLLLFTEWLCHQMAPSPSPSWTWQNQEYTCVSLGMRQGKQRRPRGSKSTVCVYPVQIVCIVNLIGLSFHVIGMIHCYHTALIGSKLIQSYYWTHQLYHIHLIGSPPEIIDKPENLTITEGSNARLPCEATGAPKPTVAWTKSESL